jgi:hypothetical protein
MLGDNDAEGDASTLIDGKEHSHLQDLLARHLQPAD